MESLLLHPVDGLFFENNLGKLAPGKGKPFWILLEQEMMG